MNIYENFHRTFSGSNQNTFKVCSKCEGACEHNKIGTLLPGEKEYMAKKMGISVSEFKLRYLDILKMDDGTLIHVLKLGELCPFLNRETEVCECRDFKPLICKIYPVIFTIEAGKVNFTLDEWCQLSRKEVCRNYFKSAIPLLSRLPIPLEWFRHVVSYDDLCFDYDQLRESRKGKSKYAVFTLRELLSFQINEVPPHEIDAYRTEINRVDINRVDMWEIKIASQDLDFGQEIEEPIY
jgi:Fe-S-cluster containining protein